MLECCGRTALVTGITGQDGSYLAELLLSKGYVVHGIIRRTSMLTTHRIDHLYTDRHEPGARLFLHHADLTSSTRMLALLESIAPDEVYHLAAQSHVRVSFEEPEHTAQITGLATLRLLETIRLLELDCRFYQASSSEMYGDAPAPQSERTEFRPRSPYAAAKLWAHWTVRQYREAYGLHAVNGILFNHESPRRGETFVTRKIARAAARIKLGLQEHVHLGNLTAVRDWGYAPEYVEAMWRMLQRDDPDDYVVATGVGHTVADFARLAFARAGLDADRYIRHDPRYERPLEVGALIGDAAKARALLDWTAKVHTPQLAALMVDAELDTQTGATSPDAPIPFRRTFRPAPAPSIAGP